MIAESYRACTSLTFSFLVLDKSLHVAFFKAKILLIIFVIIGTIFKSVCVTSVVKLFNNLFGGLSVLRDIFKFAEVQSPIYDKHVLCAPCRLMRRQIRLTPLPHVRYDQGRNGAS